MLIRSHLPSINSLLKEVHRSLQTYVFRGQNLLYISFLMPRIRKWLLKFRNVFLIIVVPFQMKLLYKTFCVAKAFRALY